MGTVKRLQVLEHWIECILNVLYLRHEYTLADFDETNSQVDVTFAVYWNCLLRSTVLAAGTESLNAVISELVGSVCKADIPYPCRSSDDSNIQQSRYQRRDNNLR